MRELGRDDMTRVAWLAERLRRGDLERSMVELAAYCNCQVSFELIGAAHANPSEVSRMWRGRTARRLAKARETRPESAMQQMPNARGHSSPANPEDLARDGLPVREPEKRGVQPLRGARDLCVPPLEGLQQVLGGHGGAAEGLVDRAGQQRRGLRTGKLQVDAVSFGLGQRDGHGQADHRLPAQERLVRRKGSHSAHSPQSLSFPDWIRGLERWPGALREAELARDVVMWGEERPPYTWRDGAAGMARWLCVVAERKGEQRVREAICERLREWAIG